MMIVGSLPPGASEAVNQEVVAEKLCIASTKTTKTTTAAMIPRYSSHPNATTSKSNPAISSNGKLGAEEVWETHGRAPQKLWHWKSDVN